MSYADSLRQQAKWIREALDPDFDPLMKITLDDVDIDELDAAADEIERLRNVLARIASKNDLSGISEHDLESAARHSLYECEMIARDALTVNGKGWDAGEHEGCGIDSQLAFEKWRTTMAGKVDPLFANHPDILAIGEQTQRFIEGLRQGQRPSGSNADEWHLFLSQYLDTRATQPNGLTYIAVQIAEAIDAALSRT